MTRILCCEKILVLRMISLIELTNVWCSTWYYAHFFKEQFMKRGSLLKTWLKDDSGQAMSEYGLLLALVAVGLIVTVVAFRDALVTKFNSIKNSITSAT